MTVLARPLEARERRGEAVGVELLGRRAPDHDRRDPLAPALVGDPDHGDLLDARVRGEDVLDLERMHVLAPRDDHVVDPAVEPEVAVLVEVPRVPGRVPAVADRLRVRVGSVPVAREGLVGAQLDLDLAVCAEAEPRVDARVAPHSRASPSWSRPIVKV